MPRLNLMSIAADITKFSKLNTTVAQVQTQITFDEMFLAKNCSTMVFNTRKIN